MKSVRRKSLIVRCKRFLRYLYLRFLRLRGSPKEIARGFAIGIFWGMFPLPGIQMLTAIVTAALFRGSKVAAAAGTWLTNPLTAVPFTVLHFHVGQLVLRREWSDVPVHTLDSIDDLMQLGGDFITSFLVGCVINGTIAGIACYFLGVPIIRSMKRRAARRRIRRHQRKFQTHSDHSLD